MTRRRNAFDGDGKGLNPISCLLQWVEEQVAALKNSRERMWEAVSKYAPPTVKSSGAFYYFIRSVMSLLPISVHGEYESSSIFVLCLSLPTGSPNM